MNSEYRLLTFHSLKKISKEKSRLLQGPTGQEALFCFVSSFEKVLTKGQRKFLPKLGFYNQMAIFNLEKCRVGLGVSIKLDCLTLQLFSL